MFKTNLLKRWGLYLGMVCLSFIFVECVSSESVKTVKRETWKSPYLVKFAAVPPVIDGKLDDKVWQEAVPLTDFYEYGTTGNGKIKDVAVMYLAWDKNNLYYAAKVNDKDLYVTEKKNDANLCRADVVRLFIKPRDNRFDEYEFEFNMRNVLWERHYINWIGSGSDRFEKPFTSGAIVKSTHQGTINNYEDVDEGYIVEVAIPFRAFNRVVPGGPVVNETWKFNACLYDFSLYREKTLMLSSFDGNTRGFGEEYKLYPSLQFVK